MTISRSRGSAGAGESRVYRIAPGSLTVLCSYGYLRRASTRTGDAPLSSRCFNSSLEIRGTDTEPYCRRRAPEVSTCQRHGGVYPAARWKGTTRPTVEAEPLGAVRARDSMGGGVAFASIAQPGDRRPQCTHRRKMVPGSHHAL